MSLSVEKQPFETVSIYEALNGDDDQHDHFSTFGWLEVLISCLPMWSWKKYANGMVKPRCFKIVNIVMVLCVFTSSPSILYEVWIFLMPKSGIDVFVDGLAYTILTTAKLFCTDLDKVAWRVYIKFEKLY